MNTVKGMKVNFIYKPSSKEELVPQSAVSIIKTIELSRDAFIEFMNYPLRDYDFIKENSEAMFYDQETEKYNSILVTNAEFNFAFVIHSSGYSYGRYVAYIPKCVLGQENE